MEYRNRKTGKCISYQELIKSFPNVYIPPLPTDEYMDSLNFDIVREVVPQPPEFYDLVRNGCELRDDGRWYQLWRAIPWSVSRTAARKKEIEDIKKPIPNEKAEAQEYAASQGSE
jgi:hypothetical protein